MGIGCLLALYVFNHRQVSGDGGFILHLHDEVKGK